MGVEEEMVVCAFKIWWLRTFMKYWLNIDMNGNLLSINVEFQYIKKFKPF